MIDGLKQEVYEANLELVNRGVVLYTWGNVSAFDRKSGLMVIKPSGVPYETMTYRDMVIVDVETGNAIESQYKPSSDTPTHLELYRHFQEIGGIAHTHSTNAVAFAQAGMPIKPFGTTHADYFYGEIPCTRSLTREEVLNSYEKSTGEVIIETFNKGAYMSVPGVLVRNHGPFTWGSNAHDAVFHAVVLEEVASMGIKTALLNPDARIEQFVLDKHYQRKHGENAYYGQDATH